MLIRCPNGSGRRVAGAHFAFGLAHAAPAGERNNVVRTCESGRRACRFQEEEGRDAELSTNLRGNGRNPETHGVLRSVMSSLC